MKNILFAAVLGLTAFSASADHRNDHNNRDRNNRGANHEHRHHYNRGYNQFYIPRYRNERSDTYIRITNGQPYIYRRPPLIIQNGHVVQENFYECTYYSNGSRVCY